MTKKVNLIYAKRGRDDYLSLALHNLNLLEDIENFDVAVYIGEDVEKNINQLDYDLYKNLKINHFYVPNLPQAGELFCKSHILSEVLNKMCQDYDWFSIMDTDMIYRKDWLKHIARYMDKPYDKFIRCNGYRVGSRDNYKDILRGDYDYAELRDKFAVSIFEGFSQITISKELNKKICNILKINNLYDFHSLGYDFVGYGEEDEVAWSLVSKYPNVTSIIYASAWCHVWHESRSADYNQKNRDSNKEVIWQDSHKKAASC